eukprot:8859853-Pyramimonas_sp.AAC.1
MDRAAVHSVQWRDTRCVIADRHAEGSIDRDMLLHVVAGTQSIGCELMTCAPYRTQAAKAEPGIQ